MEEKKPQEPLQAARGMHDILPSRSDRYASMESAARKVFSAFNYTEIRTPVMEPAELYERAIGETTDIVEKEMFVLKDRGDRRLCLRPEGTAGIVRAYIENNLGHEFPIAKFFYIGPMFRAERPQKGRYREFVQIGSEYFGNERPAADAETIILAHSLIKKFGLSDIQILVNTIGCPACRPKYLEVLKAYLEGKKNDLCENCRTRLVKNPLRALDCKEDADKFGDAPKTVDHLCEACRTHYASVLEHLKSAQVPFAERPRLVRGLDYYTRTVFEVYSTGNTGSQGALAAGGRYDGLVEQLGGNPVPAVGFALGVERVLNELDAASPVSDAKSRRGVFLIPLGAPAYEVVQKLLIQVREAGIPAESGAADQSIKSQMRLADRIGAEYCVIIGDNELASGEFALKNLESKSQQNIPKDKLVQVLVDRYSVKS